MANRLMIMRRAALALMASMPLASGHLQAQQCTAEQIAAAVDQAGASLREITRVNQPKLDARIKALQAKRGWTDAEAEEKALDALSDARTAELDRTSNDLLARIDQLGNIPPRTVPECGRLQELDAASLELQAAVKAKSATMLARADALIASSNAAATVPPATPPPATPQARPPAPPQVATVAPTPKPAAPAPSWSTTTTVEAQPLPPVVATPPPASTPPPPPITTREDDGYSIDEIVRASSGFFGKVSAGLGSVVEHAFSSIGRPTGYILGEEGGGAFLAGLRYGSGKLYLRDGTTMPVYWHGPSIGLDVGGQGAKIMFLVYRMRDPDQLWPTFTSLEGSAFLAGGLGMTLMTNGGAQLAPIRSGIGLRVGASVGYVRFTRKPTWNPF